jgi:hypothetical protein
MRCTSAEYSPAKAANMLTDMAEAGPASKTNNAAQMTIVIVDLLMCGYLRAVDHKCVLISPTWWAVHRSD